ncbi:MAG: tetratricopeptide (TPR) repeat protein [Halieaceae bacterium]|jgi:tetratricopeptide (TPR) repeat protein
MREGDFQGAHDSLRPVLALSPEDSEACYLIAVCLRYLRRFPEAQDALTRLLAREPDNGRALQELAHLARDQEQRDTAIHFYGQALRTNPALIASYRHRLALLKQAGRHREAAATAAQLARVEALPKALIAVTDLLAQGRILKAESLCRQFLRSTPHHPEAMRLLADIGVRLGALEEAHFLLESACELEPENTQLRIEFIRVLSKRQRFDESLAQAQQLAATAPDNLQYRSLRAIEDLQSGNYDAAIQAFDSIIAALPGDPATLTSRGHALKTCGRSGEAISSYEEAAEQAQHGEAWYALANLKTYRFDERQIARMQSLQELPQASLMERVYLSFALGKACEDSDDHQNAFAHYARGNALKRSQLRYRSEQFTSEVDLQCQQVHSALLEQHAGGGCRAKDPIFIVGMPRAGSTLLEQILATHSQIQGTRELPNILSLAQRLRRKRTSTGEVPGYPAILQHLDAAALRELGEEYLEQTRMHRDSTPLFIDKMPNNFRHIGLIHLILPNARIIDARREPMACCFSNFQQLFAEGQEFSYDLGDVGHYYRDYLRLMNHWDQVLPDRVFRLEHETLLDDFEGELRRLMDYLKLPFEEQCLRYYESDRAVRTPSSEQVRMPLFRDAVDKWHDYEAWLGPLKNTLGDAFRTPPPRSN